ncbi:hypothetical protein O0L34_g17661 [Tuta absoluta]|nr:hypothetical protein O0L34_g17661 [Tuta absoluta]
MEPGKKLFWTCRTCFNVKSSTPNQTKPVKESTKILIQPLDTQSLKFIKAVASNSTSAQHHYALSTMPSAKTTTLTPTETPDYVIEKNISSSDPSIVECASSALNEDGALTNKLYASDDRELPVPELCDDDNSSNDYDLQCFIPLITNENITDETLSYSIKSNYIKLPETIEKITLRKKNNVAVNIPVANSFESLSINSEADSDNEDEIPTCLNFRASCLELNNMRIQNELELLREKVILLEQQLASADSEIVNLLSENFTLKEDVAKYTKKCNYLGKLCHTSSCKKQKVKSAINKTMPMVSNTEEISEFQHHPTKIRCRQIHHLIYHLIQP